MIVDYKNWKIELAFTIRQIMELQESTKSKDTMKTLKTQLKIFNLNKISGPDITIDNFTDEDIVALSQMKEKQAKDFLGKK